MKSKAEEKKKNVMKEKQTKTTCVNLNIFSNNNVKRRKEASKK
jgi:hypothetical protein